MTNDSYTYKTIVAIRKQVSNSAVLNKRIVCMYVCIYVPVSSSSTDINVVVGVYLIT